MEGSKTCSTPTTPGKTLSRYEGAAMADPTVYCSTIGALQYLIVTMPDILYIVNKLIITKSYRDSLAGLQKSFMIPKRNTHTRT